MSEPINNSGAPYYFDERIEDLVTQKSTRDHVRNRLDHLISQTRIYDGFKEFISELYEFVYECEKYPESRNMFDPGQIKIDNKRLADFAGNRRSSIDQQSFRAIVYFLHFRKQWTPGLFSHEIGRAFSDPVFHAMVNFLDVGQEHLQTLMMRAPGLYLSYTPSITFRGSFSCGLLHVSTAPESPVLRVHEVFRSKGVEGRFDRELTYDGYLFRRSRKHFILRRNNAASTLSLTILPDYELLGTRMAVMNGIVLDMSGSHPYTCRVLYERIDDGTNDPKADFAAHIDRAQIIKADEIPPSVLAYFEDEPHPYVRFF